MARTAPFLVRDASFASDTGTESWEDAAVRVIRHESGFLRVLGGPGTGKSSLTARVAAERVVRWDVSPENVLVLTSGRDAAERMRADITRILTGNRQRTTPEPLVRTVHSYAFAVLRARAVRNGQPAPRLHTNAEQDAWIRELLQGHARNPQGVWPESLWSALTVPAFATELRDFLLRATERGIEPAKLRRLGVTHNRPEWTAAGWFAEEYAQVARLYQASGNQPPEYDAAELIGAALDAFATDADLLAEERQRVRYLLVDDAQHLDPQQHKLVEELGTAASEWVLLGDPDQSVFSFRGADPSLLSDADEGGSRAEVLTVNHRMAPEIRTAVQRLSARLPGIGPQRELVDPDVAESGTVQVRLLATEAQQASWIADQLRRAHLLDEIPWSRMAVVMRSTGLSLPVLRRALLAAGVPVDVPTSDVPLAQRSAVRPMLRLLRCAARPSALDADTAADLLASPLGGADPLALRRLRRGLRQLELAAGGSRPSGELLAEALSDADRLAGLENVAARPARRLAELLRRARESVAAGASVEETLWTVWQASELRDAWLTAVDRGGAAGAQADRDLDAMVALFEAAKSHVDRLPGAGAAGFADELEQQQIASSSLAPSAPRDNAVRLLTAHSAIGREWDVVAVPGVQEGVWPDLRQRGSLLGVERLVDVLSCVDSAGTSVTAPLLAEERRLLLVAASRARSRLLVSAVRGEDEQPSRFLDELDGSSTDEQAEPRAVANPQRGLSIGALVGELRRVVCDPEQTVQRRQRAAVQLARLADAGVPGADPRSWYGLVESSSTTPLVDGEEPVRVSPSTVEQLNQCPLRWMLERHGGQDTAELAAVTGTLVHEIARLAGEGANREQLRQALDDAWKSVDAGAPWFSRKERERVHAMVEAFLNWLTNTRGELTQAGVEQDLELKLPPRAEGGPWLRLRGRVDRLETDESGQPVIVDIKTGKTPVSRDDAEQHPQLAVYQLAAALGAFRAVEEDTEPGVAADVETNGAADVEPGGARLVYVAKSDRTGSATERGQSGLDGDGVAAWLDVLHSAAESSVGPDYVAHQNSDCARCPVRSSCPLHSAGRQVTD